MSAFQQALAASLLPNPQASSSGSGSSMSIRGTANGAPSARGLGAALRQAGIKKDGGMEVEGEVGRPVRGAGPRKSSARGSNPMDQVGYIPFHLTSYLRHLYLASTNIGDLGRMGGIGGWTLVVTRDVKYSGPATPSRH
jgi:hypothetical protein